MGHATSSVRAEGLARAALFAKLSRVSLARLAAQVDEVTVEAGQTVCTAGDPSDAVYLISHGECGVYAPAAVGSGQVLVNRMVPGESFGEMGVVTGEPRSATVRAESPSRLLRLDQRDFKDLLDREPSIARAMNDLLVRRLRRSTELVAKVTAAAAAVEARTFEPTSLADVAEQTDELGQFARVFQHMADEVHVREERLRQQVHELRIEIDEVKRARQVAEITETAYFQQLQGRVNALRNRASTTDTRRLAGS